MTFKSSLLCSLTLNDRSIPGQRRTPHANKQVIYIQAKMGSALPFYPFYFYLMMSSTPDLCPLAFEQPREPASVKPSDLSWTPSMMCRFVPVCEESRPMSSDLSLNWVGGWGGVEMKERQTQKEERLRKMLPRRLCRVTRVTSRCCFSLCWIWRGKNGSWEGTRKK